MYMTAVVMVILVSVFVMSFAGSKYREGKLNQTMFYIVMVLGVATILYAVFKIPIIPVN